MNIGIIAVIMAFMMLIFRMSRNFGNGKFKDFETKADYEMLQKGFSKEKIAKSKRFLFLSGILIGYTMWFCVSYVGLYILVYLSQLVGA